MQGGTDGGRRRGNNEVDVHHNDLEFDATKSAQLEGLEEQLNALGSHDWELVGAVLK